MADKTSLVIHYTDPLAKSGTTSVTYVNPNADDTKLKTLSQMLNNLTMNTYVSTDKVETTDITNATSKTVPVFTATKMTFSKASAGSGTYTEDGMIENGSWSVRTTVNYNGDGIIYAAPYANANSYFTVGGRSGSTYTITYTLGNVNSLNLPKTATIMTTETDTYQAATITITMTT